MSTMTIRTNRLRGLAALLRDAVIHGATAVQRVHAATAARPCAVLEAIPVIALPTRVVHVVHDATVSIVYGSIRLGTRGVAAVADAVIVATA